jgi:hypothetical protein
MEFEEIKNESMFKSIYIKWILKSKESEEKQSLQKLEGL